MSEILVSGNYRGMDWKITDDKELILGKAGVVQEPDNFEFEYDFDEVNIPPWMNAHYDSYGVETMFIAPIETVKMEGVVRFPENVGAMFYTSSDKEGYRSIDLSTADVSNVHNFEAMFDGCSRLETLNLSGWQTSRAENMSFMFYDCASLRNLDVSHFDTHNVEYMHSMFNGCESLEHLDVSKFDLSKTNDIGDMFAHCQSLTEIDVSNFDTSKVYGMNSVFFDCRSLKQLDLSHFDTSNVGMIYHLCYNCKSLEELKFPKDLTDERLKSMSSIDMIDRCNNLKSIDFNFSPAKGYGFSDEQYEKYAKGQDKITSFEGIAAKNVKFFGKEGKEYAEVSLYDFAMRSAGGLKVSFLMDKSYVSERSDGKYDLNIPASGLLLSRYENEDKYLKATVDAFSNIYESQKSEFDKYNQRMNNLSEDEIPFESDKVLE